MPRPFEDPHDAAELRDADAYQCDHGVWVLSDSDCDACDREWRRELAARARANRRSRDQDEIPFASSWPADKLAAVLNGRKL